VARWQLLECEISGTTVSRWAFSGRLHRVHSGVYAVGHKALGVEGRLLAAILYAGPGSALSHASAAHWWELFPYLPKTVDVVSPRQRRSLRDVRLHRAVWIDRTMHRGLPVTPVAPHVARLRRGRATRPRAQGARPGRPPTAARPGGPRRDHGRRSCRVCRLKKALCLHRPSTPGPSARPRICSSTSAVAIAFRSQR
jgi:hypothetical protein